MAANASALTRPDLGLLIIRLFSGLLMFGFGLNKFMGGTATFKAVGSALQNLGLNLGDTFFLVMGVAASLTELLGGLLVAIGLFFRPALALLLVVMGVAVITMFSRHGFNVGELGKPLIYFGIYLGLFFSGPGSYSVKA